MENVQYHFVVKFDTEDGKFELDYTTQSVIFTEGSVYQPDKKEWRRLHDSEWERDETAYNRAGDDLYFLLDKLNDARQNYRVPSL